MNDNDAARGPGGEGVINSQNSSDRISSYLHKTTSPAVSPRLVTKTYISKHMLYSPWSVEVCGDKK